MSVKQTFTVQLQREKKLGVLCLLVLSFLPISLSISTTSVDTLSQATWQGLRRASGRRQDVSEPSAAAGHKSGLEGHGH